MRERFGGVLLLGALLLGAAEPNYRDPQGRYTLRIPPGWNTTQMNSDAVQFSNGAAFVSVLVLPGSDVDQTLETIGKSFVGQWKDFAQVRQDQATLGGRPAKSVTYSGASPIGADSFLQLVAMADGQSVYLLMTQVAKSAFAAKQSECDGIARSFALSVSHPPSTPSAAASSAAPPAPPGKPASAAPAGVYRMKLVRIVDERGFEQPMTALTLLIPVDWQFQGGVQYGQGAGCHANLVHLVFRASSPDGRLGVELLPGNVWQWTDDLNMRGMMQAGNQQMARLGVRGCDIMAPMNADEFLRRAVLPAMRRGARVLGSDAMPDATSRLEEEARAAQQTALRQGMRVNIRTGAGRVRVSYDSGGQAVEEWITAMTTTIGVAGPAYNVRTGRAGKTTYYSSSADHVFAVRAPAGQLDAQERFFRLLMATVRVDPQWEARVQQVIANVEQQDINGANQRSAIATQAGQQMSRMIHDAYQNAAAGCEHSMESWSRYMRGVATFRNPDTGETLELSNEYAHAWAGPDNTYVLTDSGSYNPNSSLNGRWTQLDPVK